MANVEKLNEALKERGVTRRHIAKTLGISETSLYGKLAGVTDFKVNEAHAIADALRLTQPK